MPRFQVADLQDPERFTLLDRLSHQDLMPFVIEYYLKQRNWVTWSHYLGLLIYLFAALASGVLAGLTARQWLLQAASSLAAWIVLIPIHEAIHGLVYKILGARDVRFAVSLRQAYAYAIAHDFVIGRMEFIALALAPSLVINGVLIIITIFYPTLSFFFLALSLLHFSAAAGDWALLGYLWEKRRITVYTYDDAVSKTSYFYAFLKDPYASRQRS